MQQLEQEARLVIHNLIVPAAVTHTARSLQLGFLLHKYSLMQNRVMITGENTTLWAFTAHHDVLSQRIQWVIQLCSSPLPVSSLLWPVHSLPVGSSASSSQQQVKDLYATPITLCNQDSSANPC